MRRLAVLTLAGVAVLGELPQPEPRLRENGPRRRAFRVQFGLREDQFGGQVLKG